MFLKAPPIVKGARGIEAVRAISPAIASGLERSIALSRAHTEKGVALVSVAGELILMPAKAAAMMKEKIPTLRPIVRPSRAMLRAGITV